MSQYDKMSNEDFQRILEEIVDESPASHLLSVPGVYEVVAEHFNNEVLSRWDDEQEDDDE